MRTAEGGQQQTPAAREEPTCSLLGILGLGSVHEEREDLGGGVNFTQHRQDGPHILPNDILGLSHLRSRRLRNSPKV